jgi:HPt (histidine-containing phosphotransfer) domain-containing protein
MNPSNIPSSGPAVDMARLAEISCGDAEFERELIGDFVVQTAIQITEVHTALRGGNASGVHHAGHAIKGASRTLGAMSMGDLAQQLESMGETGMLENAEPLLAQLDLEFARVQTELEQRLGRRAA